MILLACIPTLLLLIFGMVYFQKDFSIWILNDGDLTAATAEGSDNFKYPSFNHLLRTDQERGNINDILAPKFWATVSWPLSIIYTLTYFAKCIGVMILVTFSSLDIYHCNYRFDELFFSSLIQFFGIAVTYHMIFNLRVARTFIQVVLYFLAGIFAIIPILLLNRGIINVGSILFILGVRSWLAGSHIFLGLKIIGIYPSDLRAIALTYYALIGRVSYILALVWMITYSKEHSTVSLSILGACCFIASYFASKLPFETSSGSLIRLPSIGLNDSDDNNGEEASLFTDSDRSQSNSRDDQRGVYSSGIVDVGRDLDFELRVETDASSSSTSTS